MLFDRDVFSSEDIELSRSLEIIKSLDDKYLKLSGIKINPKPKLT